MKLETSHSSEHKAGWKIVRRDNFADVPGDIVSADEDSGDCSVLVRKIDDHGYPVLDSEGKAIYETKLLSFGPGGIRIVGRSR